MESTFVFLTLFLLATASEGQAQNDGWIPYKYELYIKAFADLLPYEEAMAFCRSQGDELSQGSLVMVKESDLQTLLVNYTADVVDYIWLGGQYDNDTSEFIWDDGSQLTYTNWLDGYPRNITDGDACIEMRPLDIKQSTKAEGKWAHETCRRRNLVMCQKRIPWTLVDAVSEIIKMQNEMLILKEELAVVSSRVVPVGSIYVEYYDQPSPVILWHSLSWQDVTGEYAGLFFRAYGGGSEEWGTTQQECAPRITQMSSVVHEGQTYPWTTDIPPNGWSDYNWAGEIWNDGGPRVDEGLRFHTAGCEVRPKNKAIRIWRRTA